MSEGSFSIKKALPIIVITWILSLASTVALVYMAPGIFPLLNASNIPRNAIVADKIADNAVITAKLADGSVTSAKIENGTITAADLVDGSIMTIKVANGAVTTEKIADGAVTTSKIADGAIITIKLADGSVSSAKILDGTVQAVDLVDGSIITAKIADGAVTTNKIADYAITDLKIAGGAIPFNSTYSLPGGSTNSTSYTDMPSMSVNISLSRKSHLLIMMSSEFWISTGSGFIVTRALVNSTVAAPPTTYVTSGATMANLGSYSYIFYASNVEAGLYTVKIQWRIEGSVGTSGTIGYRTLSVLALPA